MGTSYSFDGLIMIEPPLNFVQIKQARESALQMVKARYGNKPPRYVQDLTSAHFEMGDYLPLKLVIEDDERETDEGIVQVKRGVALTYSSGEGSLSYSMADFVNRLIKLFPGHVFKGEVTAVRSDGAKAVKVMVEDTNAVDISGDAHIHFEDGSQAKLSDLL
jgi:hypothetical protein